MHVGGKKSVGIVIFQYLVVFLIVLSIFPRMFMGENGVEWNRLTYFTIQTNLFMAAYWFTAAALPQKKSAPLAVFRFCCVVAITITGVLYFIFLHGGYAESLRNQYLSGKTTMFLYVYDLSITYLNHLIVPVLACLDFLVGAKGRQLGKRHLIWPLLYPFAYFLYHTARGLLTGFFNYNFINPVQNGWVPTVATFLILLLFTLVLTLFYYSAGKMLKKQIMTERS